MRILRIIASVNPKAGGPIEGMRLSANALAPMGVESEVVSLDAPEVAEAAAFPYKVTALGPGIGKVRYTPKLPAWIYQNRDRFDAAIIHGLWHYISVGGHAGLMRAKIPYVLFPHGMMDPWFKKAHPLKHVAKQAVWFWQGRALRDASEVLFTSEEERRLARGVFRGYDYRERVVSYGTTGPADDPDGQLAAWRSFAPGLANRRYLLFLSRIHAKKGCDLAIMAFARIAAAHPDVDLVMAGPDQTGWMAELKKLADKLGVGARIHWPGMLTGDVKWGALRGAEVFVLPSHQENFGIVVAEAMACGTPVLTTDQVNIWQEVEASGGGLISDVSADGIHRSLMTWFGMTEAQRDAMRSKALKGFRERFGIDAAARDLLAALQKAAGRSVVA